MKKISRDTFEQVKWKGLKLSEIWWNKNDLEEAYSFYFLEDGVGDGKLEPEHCIELAALLLLWVEYDKEVNNNI